MATSDPPTPTRKEITSALEKEDAVALAERATVDELDRIKKAEELLELRHGRLKRSKRTAQIAQALVGYVALAGFFANAYQNYNNKKEGDEKAIKEEERWAKEFKRSQDADKYRAFFETSALATDPTNTDKRLVGYALLKEFVDDRTYDTKAIHHARRVAGARAALGHRQRRGLASTSSAELAVVAILDALSHTSDCKVLAQAARSIEKVTHRPHKKVTAADEADLEEGVEVFSLYVRRLLGRATLTCAAPKEFREVRRPLRDALGQVPGLVGATAKLKAADANTRIAQLLVDGCEEDAHAGALVDCAEEKKGYLKLCGEMASLPDAADETAACAIMK